MTDYFANIIKKARETEATGGDKRLNMNVSAAYTVLDNVSLCNKPRGDGGDNKNMSLLVPPNNFKGETLKGAEKLMPSLSPLVSPENIRSEFEERAAIFEYEGGFTRKEAEDRAYQHALREFVLDHYPAIIEQFESIIFSSNTS